MAGMVNGPVDWTEITCKPNNAQHVANRSFKILRLWDGKKYNGEERETDPKINRMACSSIL